MPATSIDEAAREASRVRTLVDHFLDQQGRLDTPVARFAAAQDRGQASGPHHRDLIPLTAPAPGEQYAFEVDLDLCTGCKACVAGCHSLNGLDEHETWRDVGVMIGGDEGHPFSQAVTTACHHCADPACLNGCPVLAYEKDPVTGIVVHLDDQCIGCNYCVLQCPYDVPKYNAKRGIVRKCDLCQSRLGAGEAPACVQACPTEAIRVVKVAVADAGRDFLAGAPDPARTRPTTRYLTRRALPARLLAPDAAAPRPQDPHWPLVILLTLFPAAVGAQAAELLGPAPSPLLARAALAAGTAAAAASLAHLGQPLRAWRVFLGLRRSWLSREVIALALWLALAAGAACGGPAWLRPVAALAGAAALGCSVMVYADTGRDFWRFGETAPRFFGSAAVLGLAAAFALRGGAGLALALGAVLAAKLAFELRALRGGADSATPAHRTSRLLAGPLRAALGLRLGFGLLALALLAAGPRWAVPILALLGEGAERYLYFRAVAPPRMPGASPS
ncbi:MAG TPA: DmsC/YnfH family molybdoenzyme membrane anchor subunit [Opitutaceae bacterium]|jgi:Fe-S-cluster-containing dehydrogenase component/DMSO reductase anchor subunit|nr:DmsC/YnfH family molybdoenzyme membrane anchor subunit [Opitutaceae bacterium]